MRIVRSRSIARRVDFARSLVQIELDEQPPEGEVLADHHAELHDLVVVEEIAPTRDERGIGLLPVAGECFGPLDRIRLARFEVALLGRLVDLRDRVLIESLTRRRRVPSEQSGVAGVEGRNLQPCELLDPRPDRARLMAGTEELEITIEELLGGEPQRIAP